MSSRSRPPGVASLVALHGFTLTGAMFDELAMYLGRPILAPDLPGHGRSVQVPATFESAAALVPAGPLLGYSMGGRIALWVALQRSVPRLVLVSTSPGLEDAASRRRDDAALADRIEEIGVEAFVDEWLAQPMFAGLVASGAEARALRLRNTAAGLAASLRGLGQGAMPYLGDRLGELEMPVLLIAGGRDERYVSIARWMAERIPHASVEIVPGVGHGVVGEATGTLAGLVREFLDIEHTFG